ncbi:MAG: hypothetical protein KY475_11875 [Planctomycetes bacterium]|nr:hypothetical protein [Planctomycetota bacterium]
MSDNPNPYETPGQHAPDRDGSFGDVVKQGFAAAHTTPAGIAWIFILFAPLQLAGAIVNALMFGSDFFAKIQSEEFRNSGEPPPEIIGIGAAGCSICLWMPVILFALPWVAGGALGQIRDRLTNQPRQSFGAHGRRHYGPLLALLLVLLAAMIAVGVVNGIVEQIITSTAIEPGDPMTMEQLRSLSRHPANIAASVVTGLLMTAVGTLSNLIGAAIVFRGRGFGDGFSSGFAFCSNHFGDVVKLYLVYVVLIIPLSLLQWVPNFVTPTVVLAAVVGLASGCYIAYLTVVNYGLASSLYAARAEPIAPVEAI